jgi:hypothetical protein
MEFSVGPCVCWAYVEVLLLVFIACMCSLYRVLNVWPLCSIHDRMSNMTVFHVHVTELLIIGKINMAAFQTFEIGEKLVTFSKEMFQFA